MSVPQPPKSLNKTPGLNLQKIRKPAAIPQGPRNIARIMKVQRDESWTTPPTGFLYAKNSVTEWMVYRALAVIFNNPEDPGTGPYLGGWPDWTYQSGQGQGAGSAVVDFVVYRPGFGGRNTGLRVVTEYFHIFTSAMKQYTDEMQKENLERTMDIVDLWDQDFLNDPSGQAVIKVVKAAIGLMDRADPIWTGTALRGSRLDRIG